jgi:signal peptidase I
MALGDFPHWLLEMPIWSSKRRRAVKEARLLLREARRVQRKYGHRLAEKPAAEVRGAITALDEALKARDFNKLGPALTALDKRLDDHLSFARKSTVREYAESIAVAVLIALFLRAFVVEAFKIPSGSMIPTLQVGDHIFVNKFIYGVRVPWTNIKFGTEYRKPRRGEVIVFIYPKEPDKDFIKRIVAVEGDEVEVRDNVLYINGKPVPQVADKGDCRYDDYEEATDHWEERRCDAYDETLGKNRFTVIFDKDGSGHSSRPFKVPPQSVFVMGDNRDNSHDSRFWGAVPYDLIKGKAMLIWWSAGEPSKLGGIRFDRMFHLVK